MIQVQNGIVRPAKSPTRRVYLDAGSNTFPTRLTFEVTRTPIDDEQPEIFGHPRDPDATHEYSVELISGDAEDLSDLENEAAENEAIEMAKLEWRTE